MKTQEYEIFIRAKVQSSLSKKDLEQKLVASLYDTETEEKISDGDDERFQVLDYEYTFADKTENRNHTANQVVEFLHVLEK